MTRTELLMLLQQEVKGLSTYLVTDDYNNAIDDALRETEWSLPVTVNFKEYWLKQRSKRHLFFYLYSENAHKFKYKQLNLQHRFDHYKILIETMDTGFEEALTERPDLFAGVNMCHLFGTKVDAGFSYQDQTGKDTTYRTDQLVDFGPKADD